MSYIQPNSRIEFFDDIGISQDYNDTLYFPTLSAKDTYFSNINRLAHVDRCYYVRERRGFVRVELPMNTLIHAQYMRFQNTSYGLKWWYAFVTDVIYINDNTTEVQFELDPMLSWMGEFSLSECFVERQHSLTDEIGDNLVPENFELGDYINELRVVSGHMQNKKIMIAQTPVKLADQSYAHEGGLYGGIYSGLGYSVYDTPSQVNAVIEGLTEVGRQDELIQIMMIPSDFVCELDSTTPKQYSVSVTKPYTSVGGYSNVRNKKLFTYPYKFLSIYNCEGENIDLKYEYFANETCDFYLRGIMNLEPVIMCLPRSYMGEGLSYPNSISMRNFPKCSWASDTYKAYLAQLGSSTASNVMATALPAVASAGLAVATGGSSLLMDVAKAGAIGVGKEISGLLAGVAIPPPMPNKAHGVQTSDILYAGDNKEFYFYQKSIRGETAKIIDNYFTMFGYADRTVHVPNMNARQRFTYVKTIGCKINCACPASDADFIEELFNKGIRFWKNHTQIGSYSEENLPLGG